MTRLTLKNGEWFDVKDDTKVRDDEFVHEFSYQGISDDGKKIHYDVKKHQISTMAVRILNWSVTDDDGKIIHWPLGKNPLKDRVGVVRDISTRKFNEMTDLLTDHIKSLEPPEPVTEKNETADGGSDSTSSLPSAS